MKDRKLATAAMAKYMTVKPPPEVLDAQVKETMGSTNAPAGKPIGWQDDAYWKASLDLLKSAGAIKEAKDVKLYYTNEFLQ